MIRSCQTLSPSTVIGLQGHFSRTIALRSANQRASRRGNATTISVISNLRTTDSELALTFRSGFANQSHCCFHFKRIAGLSPRQFSEFRKKLSKSASSLKTSVNSSIRLMPKMTADISASLNSVLDSSSVLSASNEAVSVF